jgi:hypothetical protein
MTYNLKIANDVYQDIRLLDKKNHFYHQEKFKKTKG